MHSRNALSFPWVQSCFPFACCTCSVDVRITAAAQVPAVQVRSNEVGAGSNCSASPSMRPLCASPPRLLKQRDKPVMARQLLKLERSSLLAPGGGAGSLPGFGSSVLPQRGESQKGTNRGAEAPSSSFATC